MKRLLNWLEKEWWQPAVLVVMGTPIAVYGSVFGWQITADHKQWAEMGSAMAGIYGPILAVLTYIVLLRQLRLQRQTTKHMFDESRLQDARGDMQFYLTRLSDVLDKASVSGLVPRRYLHESFETATLQELMSDELKETAMDLNLAFPQIRAVWLAFYEIYSDVEAIDQAPYRLHARSAYSKAIAMLSLRTCVALDRYLYCVTDGRIGRGHYYFCYELREDESGEV